MSYLVFERLRLAHEARRRLARCRRLETSVAQLLVSQQSHTVVGRELVLVVLELDGGL